MGKPFQLLLLGLLSFGLFLSGCNRQEKFEKVTVPAESEPKEALKIVIPDNVKGRWKSVEISVIDQTINTETTYTVNIGETIQIPDSSLRLKVVSFLPSFIMNGNHMTSQSNETRNPAAYIVVKDNQEKLFSGWLFSLYPDAHEFQGSCYNFNLVGYVPMD